MGATSNGDKDIVDFMLQNGANPDLTDLVCHYIIDMKRKKNII